ncbi:Proteasome subunit beta type-4 [Mycoemilia scoparia]|uniref:Proteasome subunit beta n=1 Tax=Mycoemilia scoparia TaxID=417184 RepID=A0A9W7ZXX5_9FUNG|nr:Proteasome subunit beta type-4 [Mycoemilia scoparia]
METQIGIRGDNFVVLLSDKIVAQSIVKMKHNQDKMKQLNKNNVMSVTGEAGDVDSFSEYIEANIKLFGLRQNRPLTTSECAYWTRGTLAEALRSRSPYNVNLLIGGFNPNTKKSSLYRIDYLSSICEVPFAAHGYTSYFAYSLMDKEYRKDLTKEEAIKLAIRCVKQLDHRFLVGQPGFILRVIDEEGIHTYDSQPILENGQRSFNFVNVANNVVVSEA